MRRGWKQSRTALAILSLLSGAWPAVAGGPTGGPRIQENRSFNRRMHLKAEALLPDGGLLAGEHGIPRPQRLRGRLPYYPGSALRKGITGKVGLLALVGADGRVEDLEVLEATPPGEGFEESCLKTVRSWVYSPAVHKGRSIAVHTVILVNFTPEEYALARKREALLDHLQELARETIYSPGAPIAGEAGVTWAVALKQRAPVYPRRARLRKIEARVFLLLHIRADGTVAEIPLAHAERTDYPFESAARRAVLSWRFQPATKNGKPTQVYQWIHVDFTDRTARR